MIEETTIYDFIYKQYKINKPIRLIELFAGIGSQSKALENLKANFEHWKICEWAIPSILAYKEIHQDYLPNYKVDYAKNKTKEYLIDYLYNIGVSSNYNEPMKYDQIKRLSENKLRHIYNAIKSENNLVNISTTKGQDLEIKETNKYDYIMCYSFPCQDLSLAGKQKGMSRDAETRSGLLWQVERLLKECIELPQILLMENVPQVIGEKNINDFREWQHLLESLGYKNYVEVLNAKDYGIPQNRKRCFMISILGDYIYNFPQKQKLELRLKDMLETNVAGKYYLSNKKFNTFKINIEMQNDPKLLQVAELDIKGNDSIKRVYDPQGLCPTITTMGGGNRQPKVLEDTNIPICLNPKGGRNGIEGIQPSLQDRVYSIEGVSTAITASFMPSIAENKKNLRIRKLTPKECYRLMGFEDLDYERTSKVISDSMIYHTAGDSIAVNVLMAIFGQLM